MNKIEIAAYIIPPLAVAALIGGLVWGYHAAKWEQATITDCSDSKRIVYEIHASNGAERYCIQNLEPDFRTNPPQEIWRNRGDCSSERLVCND